MITPLTRFRKVLVTAYRNDILYHASALSFDLFLAAIPLTFLYLSVAGFLLDVDGATTNVLEAIQPILPMQAGPDDPLLRAERLFATVVESREEFSLFGIPLFLVFSTRLFASTRIALDHMLASKTKRRWHHDLLYDLFLVVVITVLFTANSVLVIPAFVYQWLNEWAGHLVATGFGVVLFFLIYSFAPTEKLPWRTALWAAVVAAVLFESSKWLFGIYLENFVSLNRVFSHANAIAILLFVLWVYVGALIFLIGGQFAVAHYADWNPPHRARPPRRANRPPDTPPSSPSPESN